MDRSHRRTTVPLPAADGLLRSRRRLGEYRSALESHELRAGIDLQPFAWRKSGFERGAGRSHGLVEGGKRVSGWAAFSRNTQRNPETVGSIGERRTTG